MNYPKLKLFTAAAGVFLVSSPAWAQLRIYDGTRDAAAQEAKKAADKIKSGDVFNKQSQNLQALRGRDIETTVADARVEMHGMINKLRQWSDVEALSATIKDEPVSARPEDIAAQKLAIDDARTNLKAQIKSLSDAAQSEADELKPVMKTVGDVETALSFANEHLGLKDHPGVVTAMNVLKELQGLYKDYQEQFETVNKAEKRLAELKVNLKRALLIRLKVDEDHLLTQVALYARSETELKQVGHFQAQCVIPQGVAKDENIDETLDRLANNRAALERAVHSLYACASFAAEGMLPKRLLNVRLAQLAHSRSIQISAANARVYEMVVAGGAERLALFYQSGVKPATLVQLLQSLSTTGVFGKLLSQ